MFELSVTSISLSRWKHFIKSLEELDVTNYRVEVSFTIALMIAREWLEFGLLCTEFFFMRRMCNCIFASELMLLCSIHDCYTGIYFEKSSKQEIGALTLRRFVVKEASGRFQTGDLLLKVNCG